MVEIPKILIAEDEPSLADYYEVILSQRNCETAVEHTGEDAIRRAVIFRPDIALLGVLMPDISGVEAGIKLLESFPGTKVVLVSEPVPPETLGQLEAQGYRFETLTAPFRIKELYAVVFGQYGP
jgi:DNA-binding response OmpR family regulator